MPQAVVFLGKMDWFLINISPFLITKDKLTMSSKHVTEAGYIKVSERRCKMVIWELKTL